MTLDQVLGLLEGVRRTARGYSARCAAHADKSPSLSIREGNDGKVLLRCFAGCTIDEICSALHIHKRDLFPQKYSEQIRTAQLERKRREAIEQKALERRYALADVHREYESVIAAGSPIDPDGMEVEQLDRFIESIGKAHNALCKEMGEEAYAEWSARLGTSYRQISVGRGFDNRTRTPSEGTITTIAL